MGSIKKTVTLMLIIGLVCAAALSSAYLLYSHMGSQRPMNETIALRFPALPSPASYYASYDEATEGRMSGSQSDKVESETPEPQVYYPRIIIDSVRIPPTKGKEAKPTTKAQELFDELTKHENFLKALENPAARANIDRMLNHPEVEKKLNGWFAIAIRTVIHSRVKEPNFPELIADSKYVDDLFKQHGIS